MQQYMRSAWSPSECLRLATSRILQMCNANQPITLHSFDSIATSCLWPESSEQPAPSKKIALYLQIKSFAHPRIIQRYSDNLFMLMCNFKRSSTILTGRIQGRTRWWSKVKEEQEERGKHTITQSPYTFPPNGISSHKASIRVEKRTPSLCGGVRKQMSNSQIISSYNLSEILPQIHKWKTATLLANVGFVRTKHVGGSKSCQITKWNRWFSHAWHFQLEMPINHWIGVSSVSFHSYFWSQNPYSLNSSGNCVQVIYVCVYPYSRRRLSFLTSTHESTSS